MNVVEKSLKFAVLAHKNQVRKAEKEKPYIIHPIDVSNILKEYGCNDNLISAGLLHDILEDTDYDFNFIKQEFGEDIANLVNSATEQNKNESWEKRKQATINKIKNMSLEQKILLCADKLSNLEDMYILFNVKGKKDFSSFNRSEQQQKWYYDNLYNSFISNGNHEIFDRLKNLINKVFVEEFIPNKDNFLKKDVIKLSKYFNDKINFDNKIEIYNKDKLIIIFDDLDSTKKYYIEKYKNI